MGKNELPAGSLNQGSQSYHCSKAGTNNTGLKQAAEDYLSLLRKQTLDFDYEAVLKNTKHDLMTEDGFDEQTATTIATHCVERVKRSVASMKAQRSFFEHLLRESS